MEAENIYQTAVSRHLVQEKGTTSENIRIEIGNNILTLPGTGEKLLPPSQFVSHVKMETKKLVSVQDTEFMFDHIRQLVKQGKYLELSH